MFAVLLPRSCAGEMTARDVGGSSLLQQGLSLSPRLLLQEQMHFKVLSPSGEREVKFYCLILP